MSIKRKILHCFFWFIPIVVLVSSYLILCFEYEKANLLFEIVHENGKYTLLETIFYFDHFVREIIICIMMSLAIAIAFYMFSPLKEDINLRSAEKVFKLSVTLALLLLLVATVGAVIKNGTNSTLLSFLQFKTTDDLSIYGSHWHFHFFHLLYVVIAAVSVSLVYRGITGISSKKSNKFSLLFLGVWILLFIVLTLIFIPNGKPFVDTRYLAHQFREIVTHMTITVPLAFAFLIFVENKLIKQDLPSKSNKLLLKKGIAYFVYASIIPIFILIQLADKDIMSVAHKQSSYMDLLASHYFEHVIDYFFVAMLSIAFFIILKTKSEP